MIKLLNEQHRNEKRRKLNEKCLSIILFQSKFPNWLERISKCTLEGVSVEHKRNPTPTHHKTNHKAEENKMK